MTRTPFCLALVTALALVGCGKNNEETQNPGDADGDGQVDGDGSQSGDGDGAATPSRARGSSSVRGAERITRARTVRPTKPTRKPVDPADKGPNGLLVEAFELSAPDAVPDFEGLTVAERFNIESVDFDEIAADEGFPGLSGLRENYGLRMSGSLNIEAEAEYELCLHSDDGSQLLLEDTLIVDNDGIHDEPVEACELVFLPAGEYMLEIRYFQTSGPSLAMHFAWAMDGGDKVIVPNEVLFKPQDDS